MYYPHLIDGNKIGVMMLILFLGAATANTINDEYNNRNDTEYPVKYIVSCCVVFGFI